MILCLCGCGKEIFLQKHHKYYGVPKFIKGHNKPGLGQKRSEETRKKMSDVKKGKPSPRKGQHLSEETKKKISDVNKGKHNSPNTEFKRGKEHINYGKPLSEKLMVILKEERFGTDNPNWKGGKKLSKKKTSTKRRRNLGFIPLNDVFENSEAHHMDKEYVIYIPYNLHHSVSHNVYNGKNMDIINEKVIDWYTNYYGLI